MRSMSPARGRAWWMVLPVAALTLLLAACSSLPPQTGRTPSTALPADPGSRLGQLAQVMDGDPTLTGVHLLDDPLDSFAVRILLAELAERSLDLQYYIWQADTSGYLMLASLWRAAERGVRVRLLFDDLGAADIVPTLALLDAHPLIEVRLFNPFVYRRWWTVDFLVDFDRVHRRMHGKSFTADGLLTVVGGRNIGDAYFGSGSQLLFTDLDALAVGPVVAEMSAQFDLYWNSFPAYPIANLLGEPPADVAEQLAAVLAPPQPSPATRPYLDALAAVFALRESSEVIDLRLVEAPVSLLHDGPDKVLPEPYRGGVRLLPQLALAVGLPEKELDIVSPYFVPGDDGTEFLLELAAAGVRIRVFTNSLAATDVPAAHAGYAKRRRPLLAGGIMLYEMKAMGRAARSSLRDSASGLIGSGDSLHGKTFAMDRRLLVIGSFNIDLRSANHNTELGLVIESPGLAAALSRFFDREIEDYAYRLELDPSGALVWVERTASGERRHPSEPDASLGRRLLVGLLAFLPIEELL